MSPRTAKGFKWSKWTATALAVLLLFDAVSSALDGIRLDHSLSQVVDRMARDRSIVDFVWAFVFWGGLAFFLGWLTGGTSAKSEKSE